MKKIVVKIPSLCPQWIYDGNLAKIAVAKAKTKCIWYKTGQKIKRNNRFVSVWNETPMWQSLHLATSVSNEHDGNKSVCEVNHRNKVTMVKGTNDQKTSRRSFN